MSMIKRESVAVSPWTSRWEFLPTTFQRLEVTVKRRTRLPRLPEELAVGGSGPVQAAGAAAVPRRAAAGNRSMSRRCNISFVGFITDSPHLYALPLTVLGATGVVLVAQFSENRLQNGNILHVRRCRWQRLEEGINVG